jgi:hypothetical protein
MGGRGAALLSVLGLTVLMLILVSALLINSGKEIGIAGLHRDAIKAEEYAQAGLEDMIRRIAGGRAWRPVAVLPPGRCLTDGGVTAIRVSLPQADTCMWAVTRAAGPSGSFLEIRSAASAGRARRRLSTAVLARTITALPGTLVLYSYLDGPAVDIQDGVVHAQTFARPLSTSGGDRTTYAGWRIEDPGGAGSGIGPCYTHEACLAAGRPQWWPGHRRAVFPAQPLRPVPLPGNALLDPRIPHQILAYPCPAGPSPAQAAQIVGANGPGFQGSDLRADLDPADPRQAALAGEALYGCTADGLPYTWLREAFDTEDDPDADPDRFLWFPIVRFDHWLARYGCFDEGTLAWMPCNGFHPDPLLGDPSLGAVLPQIPGAIWAQNHDQRRTGGGTVTAADVDLGTCTDPPACRNPANRRPVISLDGGDYTLICAGRCPEGHGVLLVDGDLRIAGDFTYRGTVVVRGVLTVTSGSATIYGPVSARRVTDGGGTLRLFPGSPVATGAAGPAALTRRAWWER